MIVTRGMGRAGSRKTGLVCWGYGALPVIQVVIRGITFIAKVLRGITRRV